MKYPKCPACEGWQTTSGNANLIQHVKNLAKSEALRKHLLGKGATPHADWLREKVKTECVQVYTLTVAGIKATIQL